MTSAKTLVLKRYRKLGMEWGIFVGALLGVIGGGLQMGKWESPLLGWAIATLSFAGMGGLLGYLFYDLVFVHRSGTRFIPPVWAVR